MPGADYFIFFFRRVRTHRPGVPQASRLREKTAEPVIEGVRWALGPFDGAAAGDLSFVFSMS